MPAAPLILGLEFQKQIMMPHLNSFKHALVLGALLLCASSIGLGQLASDSTCVENCDHPGYRLMTQDDAGTIYTREYILHVPSNYDQNQSYPLVIVYHGFGDCAAFWADAMENVYGFNAIADAEGFLVAYPQAAYRPEKEDVYWEPGNSGGDNIYHNDMYFTQALIGHIAQDYSINQNLVYAAGYSNGGMLAYSIGCTRGDLVAGVGVMSGAMLDDADTCTDSFPIPIIIFHGVGDFVLPYNGNEWYGPVSETVDLWLNQNQIPASSLNSTTLNGGDVQLDQYSGGLQGTCLSFYTINQEYGAPGGHVWFTQEIDGVAPGQLLWDFFNDGCDGAFTTGLNETDTEPIGFYPNPIADQLHATSAGAQDLFVQLVNLHGQTILSGQLKDLNDRRVFRDLSRGLYLLQYGNETQLLVKE